jgi:membrane protein DedA with SNARE-associated domain/rhodanese-related sulfurtransferase
MPLALEFFLHYAYPIIFLWVVAEQLGAPVPSIPILLTAGSLTATHKLSLILVLVSVIAGCLVSDSVWYLLGKRFGGSVVKLLCRLSLEASTCVRKTENYFTKHGPQALLFAKFIPGLGTVAAPIAGQTGMRYSTFLTYDLSGAFVWGVAVTVVGRFFGDVLKRRPQALSWVAHFAGILFVLAIIGFLLYRVWKQQSFLKQVKTARLEPEELKEMLDSGQKVFIVDLRHPLDYLPDPRVLPGALRVSPEDLMRRSAEIPRDQDVVLYCTCPSEATAAKTAMRLRQIGIHRVRPLLGGFDAWKQLGYPLEDYEEQPAGAA